MTGASLGSLEHHMFIVLLLLCASAHATWSVLGLDPETGEVGVAGATCGPMVAQIAQLAPGHGAVVSQYATSIKARRHAAELLEGGATPDEVIADLSGPWGDDELDIRQYGVVAFNGPSAGFDGAEIEAEHNNVGTDTFRALGNTLRTDELPADAEAAWLATEGEPLAERLMSALEAGRDDGGDSRCPEDRPARSAFLHVATEDDPRAVSLETDAVFGGDPVAHLREHFDAGKTGCAHTRGGEARAALFGAALLLARRRRRG